MKNGFIDFILFPIPEAKTLAEQCEGDNRENVLVIFRAAGKREELTGFLHKVLGAVKLDTQKDIALLSLTADQSISLTGLAKQIQVEKVLVFGIKPTELGLQFNYALYHPFVLNERTFLFADDLRKIYEDRQKGGKELAGALWKALKVLFPLNV